MVLRVHLVHCGFEKPGNYFAKINRFIHSRNFALVNDIVSKLGPIVVEQWSRGAENFEITTDVQAELTLRLAAHQCPVSV